MATPSTSRYGVVPLDVTHFLARHLLLARRRRASIGRHGRVDLLIAQALSCSDFRVSLSFAFYRHRRLRSCWPHGHAAAAVLVMHDQSIMSCIFSQASSCGKLSCMIDADHMPIRHVSGDLHFADVFHEVIISSCR